MAPIVTKGLAMFEKFNPFAGVHEKFIASLSDGTAFIWN